MLTKRKLALATIVAAAAAMQSGVTFASPPNDTEPFWGLWPSAITQPPRKDTATAAKEVPAKKEQKAAVTDKKMDAYLKSSAGQAETELMTGPYHEATKHNP